MNSTFYYDRIYQEVLPMKKITISTILLGALLLVGCNNTKEETIDYQVSKEQYEQACSYEAYVARITSLNFTVTTTETVGERVIKENTKFDNGKIMSCMSYGDFYCDFKEGTYNAENETWSYDGYFESEGVMKKVSFENETMPDDILLPDIEFFASYEEMSFNSETNFYEQIEEKTLNDYYVYSEVKAQFINGNIVYASYKYMSTFEPEKVYLNVIEITDYGSTVVNIPNVE